MLLLYFRPLSSWSHRQNQNWKNLFMFIWNDMHRNNKNLPFCRFQPFKGDSKIIIRLVTAIWTRKNDNNFAPIERNRYLKTFWCKNKKNIQLHWNAYSKFPAWESQNFYNFLELLRISFDTTKYFFTLATQSSTSIIFLASILFAWSEFQLFLRVLWYHTFDIFTNFFIFSWYEGVLSVFYPQ